MIIDSNLILFEGAVKTGNGDAVALNSLQIPGKAEPINITTKFTENLAGATSVTLTLEQSDSQDGTYSAVSGASLSIAAADFVVGKRIGWRFIPRTVVSPWLRLKLTVTGTATAGKIFCAISGYDDEPYEAGQYINKGIVQG